MMGNKTKLISIGTLNVKCILRYNPVEDNFDANLNFVCLNKEQEVCSVVNYSQSTSAIKYLKSDNMAEEFLINLSKMGECSDIYFVVSILNGLKRNQNLAMISSISLIIPECNLELKINELSDTDTCLVIGRLYNSNGEWKIQHMQEAYAANFAYQIFL